MQKVKKKLIIAIIAGVLALAAIITAAVFISNRAARATTKSFIELKRTAQAESV